MIKQRKLIGFAIEADKDDYLIALEDESGTTIRFSVTREQLDMVADLIEECVDSSEASEDSYT